MHLKLSLCLLLFFSILNLNAHTTYFPPKNTSEWQTISLESLNWNPNQVDSLLNYLDSKHTKGFIILVDGKLALEHYFGSFTQDSLWYWASAGKSLTAYLTGIAQQEGFLDINDKTSDYLGIGWTSLSKEQEDLITIKHQLSMTTGLDDYATNPDCTAKECLVFKAEPGTRWAYHNAPYTLIEKSVASASNLTYNQFTNAYIKTKIGMQGAWIKIGYNNVFFSNTRSMARFGLLALNNGIWDQDTVLRDENYIADMPHSSQNLNPSYGYLWWLNGQSSHMQPRLQISFSGSIIPSAPSDMYAALGKNDQKIYVVPSKNMVVVRMGDKANESTLALSDFDDKLWKYINRLELASVTKTTNNNAIKLLKSPDKLEIINAEHLEDLSIKIYAINGKLLLSKQNSKSINTQSLFEGVYVIKIESETKGLVKAEVFRKFSRF